jgi:hypothetical protein
MQTVDDRNGENQVSEVEGGKEKLTQINLDMLLRLEINLLGNPHQDQLS